MRRSSLLSLLLISGLAIFSCGRDGSITLDPERCDNQVDDDLDGHVDCDDQDCYAQPACDVDPVEICDNDLDDDDDGYVDCDDADCTDSCEYLEVCDNQLDDDGDTFADCEDQDCWTNELCDETPAEVCDNQLDDDEDGDVDCADADCLTSPLCPGAGELCQNNQDDDEDTLIDCQDPDCFDAPACQNDPEVCNNSQDDDGDGDVDCDDPDCAAHAACLPDPEICDNTVDDDGDGAADCADDDCDAHANCQITAPELCANALDDDGDGDLDCDDADCAIERDCFDYTGALGAACRTNADCTDAGAQCGTEIELGLPGGYCTKACSIMNPCALGSTCITDRSGTGTCAKTCASATDCRIGYQCTTPAGASANVCNPSCRRDWQCRDTRVCSTNTGLCTAQELCLTAGDDDGDGAINCADSNCAAETVCGCVEDDRYNVQWTTAFALDLADATPLTGSICGPTYQDWFVFTPSATVSVTFTLNLVNAQGDLDLYLYTASNLLNSVAIAYTTSDVETFNYAVQAGQTYYLLVEGYHRAGNAYTLTVTQ